MHPLLNIAVNAARQAGDIIIRNIELMDRIKVTEKGYGNVSTDVNIKAEQAIINAIYKAYPEHGIIAEESGIHHEDAETMWLIDPLVGTNNYLHGLPSYSVSIAIRIKNRIEHAVVYDPLRHECFTASRGGGSRLNDRRIRVSKQTQLSASLIGTGPCGPNKTLENLYLSSFSALYPLCTGQRQSGVSALDLAYVASGRLEAFWQFGAPLLTIAAGSLLVQEAGGLISCPRGSENYLKQGDIVAATPKVFKSLLQTLTSTINV